MHLAALLASLLAASAATAKKQTPAPPPPPPRLGTLAPLAGAPLGGSPSFTPDGKKVLLSRFGPSREPMGHRGKLYLVALDHPEDPEAIDILGNNDSGDFRARLSPDGKRIAYLADGELWVVDTPASEEADRPGRKPEEAGLAGRRAEAGGRSIRTAPERLYPPKEGDAPLGPRLTQMAWVSDGTWLLIQSPLAWARVSVETGEVALLPLKPSDLTGGSLLLGPDGVHAAFVRPTSGAGWINGAKVVVLNLETGQAQIADFDHDYTEVAALPDGQLLGKDANGTLWVLRGRARVLYFQPPPNAGATAGQYTLSLDGSRLAYVSTTIEGTRSQLFVGGAPTPPPWPKRGHDPDDVGHR